VSTFFNLFKPEFLIDSSRSVRTGGAFEGSLLIVVGKDGGGGGMNTGGGGGGDGGGDAVLTGDDSSFFDFLAGRFDFAEDLTDLEAFTFSFGKFSSSSFELFSFLYCLAESSFYY